MQQNAQLVLALGEYLGLDQKIVKSSLRLFGGTWRRMEVKGTTLSGVTVIDDYAHHPTEIRATLKALREAYPKHRIVCVFQPHTHDRTLKLWQDFSLSFRDASVVIIPNIYDARSEQNTGQVKISSLVQAIAAGSGITCIDGKSLNATTTLLRHEFLKKDDLLVVMGAGDVTELATEMLR